MAFAPPANIAGVAIPAIPANPPSLSDITNTKDYVQRLIQSKACRAEIIPTDDEIGAAELYHYEVVLRTSLGGEAAPPWLQDLVDNVRLTGQAVERIEQRVDEIVDTLRLTRRTVERTSAVVDNMRIANLNIELAKNTGSTSYRAKRKEVDGDGTNLANSILPHNQHPLVPLAAAPATGTVFSLTIDTHNLTHPIILRLVQYYNQTFNIQPGDTMPIRSQKITNWLTSQI